MTTKPDSKKIEWTEVKKRKRELWRLESNIAKIERMDKGWRQSEIGMQLLEQYSKAVDRVLELNKYFSEKQIIAYSLAPDPDYSGSY